MRDVNSSRHHCDGASRRIAVLIKQVPRSDQLAMVDGLLRRTGVELEVNPYCRRAITRAIHLAGAKGEVVAFTMGPPSAEDALREMIAAGASRAVHACDPAFAGSDTLATARVLSAAIRAEGRFDLVLCGLSSVDADTGQVGPQVAEMLGLPFAAAARELRICENKVHAKLETDDGYRWVIGPLPMALSAAERLCEPSKACHEARARVNPKKIVRVDAKALHLSVEEVGLRGSLTQVGPVSSMKPSRAGRRAADVGDAVVELNAIGAFDRQSSSSAPELPSSTGGPGPEFWCFFEAPERASKSGLLGEAAILAAKVDGSVTAVIPVDASEGLARLGADRVLVISGGTEPDQWARALAYEAAARKPFALLLESTRAGRAVAAKVAARNNCGLIGDAIELEISVDHRLVAFKPCFGGRLMAPIESVSDVQMVTVRPGVLSQRVRSVVGEAPTMTIHCTEPADVRTTDVALDDPFIQELLTAQRVIGVGIGVSPSAYDALDELRNALGGAPLAATRKVTDRGWLPRSRQVGITGHSIAPRLYIAIGLSGKLNHAIGVTNAHAVLAINRDPDAPIFADSDVGLVGDWRELVPELARAICKLQGPAASGARSATRSGTL